MTIVLCAHGTRSAGGRARVNALIEAVAARVDVPVLAAYVDVHGPTLGETLRPGMTLVPLLLTAGFHVRVDLAGAALEVGGVAVAPALGPSPLLTRLLARRLTEAGLRSEDALVLAAAGSSEDSAARAVEAQAADLAAALDRTVNVAYGASRAPLVADQVRRLRADGAERVVLASYLLAPGHFHRKLHLAGADAVTSPLIDVRDVPPELVDLVVERFREVQLATL